MRLLTVRQPWAALIAGGLKTVELRSWRTSYRGTIAIVAGLGKDVSEFSSLAEGAPLGIVAVVQLLDVVPAAESHREAACCGDEQIDWSAWFSWVLMPLHVVSPVPIRGTLGLTRVPNELRDQLRPLCG